AHPLHMSIEGGVAEKAANECGDFILRDLHHNQTIALMAKFGSIETCVAGEKRDISASAQKRHDLLVLHPLASDVDATLPCRYSRDLQQKSLAVENIFVENDQAWARSSTYSWTVYWSE